MADAGFATPNLFPINQAHLQSLPWLAQRLFKESTPRCIGVGDDIEQWRENGNDGGAISTPAPFPRAVNSVFVEEG
jgi:hypothetical protein